MRTLLWIAIGAYLVAPTVLAPVVCGAVSLWRAIRRALTPNVMVIRVPVPMPVRVPVPVAVMPPPPDARPHPLAPPPQLQAPLDVRRGDFVDYQGTRLFGLVHVVDGETAWCRAVLEAKPGHIRFADASTDLRPWPARALRVLERDYVPIEAVSPVS